jgi:hypothetical protein
LSYGQASELQQLNYGLPKLRGGVAASPVGLAAETALFLAVTKIDLENADEISRGDSLKRRFVASGGAPTFTVARWSNR